MTSLHQSHSQKIINTKNKVLIPKKETIQIFNVNTPSPSTVFINYGYNKNHDLSRNFNKKLTSISLSENKTKYDNFYIFSKREYAFNKSIENNKKVFKYHNYSYFEEKKQLKNQKKAKFKRNNDNILSHNHSSLYLTQNILKTFKTKLPLIYKEKSINKDNDSTFRDKNQNKTHLIKKDITYLRNIINYYDIERICKSNEEKKRNKKIF